MADVVAGDWKEFEFRMIQESDYPRVLEHLRTFFYRDEPLCKQMGYEEILAEDFDACVLGAFEDKLSFLAVHKPTNKIAAVRITTIAKRNEIPELPSFKCPKSTIIINLLTKATLAGDLFGKYPEVESYADFFMASVNAEFRGHGLATEMYKRALKLFTSRGISFCKVVLTSPFTRKATTNLGFTEISRIYLKDYKDIDGKPFFPNANPEDVVTCAVFKIK